MSTAWRLEIRTVPAVSALLPKQVEPEVPARRCGIYCSEEDFSECAGLALGSPTRFGNMAGAMKHFLDGTGAQWMSGSLIEQTCGRIYLNREPARRSGIDLAQHANSASPPRHAH